MKDFIKKVFITSLLIFGCLFCMPFSNHQVDAKAMTPAEEWKANSFPSEDWTTDNYTYHKVGFINDSNHKQLLLYIDMYPILFSSLFIIPCLMTKISMDQPLSP